MAAHRYWRLVGITTWGGATLRLRALHWYLDGTRVDSSATVTATIAPSTGSVSTLQSLGASGVVEWPSAAFSAPGFAIVWDFGTATEAKALRFMAADLAASLFAITIQSSDDGLEWATENSTSGITWYGDGIWTVAPDSMWPPVDAYDALFMRFNGTNGDTTYVEEASGHTFTSYGGASLTSTNPIDGATSLSVNGSTGYIQTPSSPEFDLGAGPFTIRAKIRPAGFSEGTILARSSGTYYLQYEWALLMHSATRLRFYVGVRGASTSEVFFDLPFTMVAGTAYRVVMGRNSAGERKCFVDGQLCTNSYSNAGVYDFAVLNDPTAALPLSMGAFIAGGLYLPFNGLIDDVRIRKGESPEQAYATWAAHDDSVSTAVSATAEIARAADIEYGGQGRVYGTVKLDDDPTDLPLRRRVRLHREQDAITVRETWSDADTGAFSFDWVAEGVPYIVYALDHTGEFEVEAESGKYAEPMP